MDDRGVLACDGSWDVDRAVAELGERLPAPLQPLARLAFNYRWSWLHGGAAVFRDIAPDLWARSGCNPRWLIEAVPPHRLRELAEDADYVRRACHVMVQVAADLGRPAMRTVAERQIAYCCSEFAVHCSLPIYGGGLGVLAGDLLKEASDLAIPMVGVGLLYRQGYFRQRLDAHGMQHEYWNDTDFERCPLVLVTDRQHRPVVVEVLIRGRTVHVQVWRANVGRVPLYLLDTDREDNHAIDRWITARLYVGDRHTRLAQYAVLGLGGARALRALGIRPSIVHLNEGHAALAGVERLREHLRAGFSADDALAAVRREMVFTTHTPVDAGNEWYAIAEVEQVLGRFAASLGAARPLFHDLGRLHGGDGQGPFNLTPLALRTSSAANAVSQRHGEVARAMWRPLWPDLPVERVPIQAVTNGVHTATWMHDAMQALLDRYLPGDWRARVSDPAVWEGIARIPDAELWTVRRTLRAELVDLVRAHSARDRLGRGEPSDRVEAAAQAFDPDVFTIGFARRVATYKRLHLLTRHLDRALRLLASIAMPTQVVIAGKAHPQDGEAKETLRTVFAVRQARAVASRVVFLEDYDLYMAPCIVAGADLWLNLPRPPMEASGTSGMKAVVNGGLNLSVRDGWWVEGYDGETGWVIDTPPGDPYAQDEHDTTVLFDLVEHEVVPLFYNRGDDGIPHSWVAKVKTSMQRLGPRFSAQRMLLDYVGAFYAPERP